MSEYISCNQMFIKHRHFPRISKIDISHFGDISLIYGLVHERRNYIANAMELNLFCTNPSISLLSSTSEARPSLSVCNISGIIYTVRFTLCFVVVDTVLYIQPVLCFVVVCYRSIHPYPSGLLHWHGGIYSYRRFSKWSLMCMCVC